MNFWQILVPTWINPCNIFDNVNLNKIQQEDGVTDLQGKIMIELWSDKIEKKAKEWTSCCSSSSGTIGAALRTTYYKLNYDTVSEDDANGKDVDNDGDGDVGLIIYQDLALQ